MQVHSSSSLSMIINIEKSNKNNNEGEIVTEDGDNDRNKNSSEIKFNIPVATDIATVGTFKESYSDTATMAGRRGGKDRSNQTTGSKALATSQKGILLEKERIIASRQPTNTPKKKVLAGVSNVGHDDNADSNNINIDNSNSERCNHHTFDVRLALPKVHNSDTLNGNKAWSHDPIVRRQLLKTTCPGAVSVSPEGIFVPVYSIPFGTAFVNDDAAQLNSSLEDIDIESCLSYDPPVNAFIVVDSCEITHITATILDIEAEEKNRQKHQIKTILVSFITAIIVAFVFQLGNICMG